MDDDTGVDRRKTGPSSLREGVLVGVDTQAPGINGPIADAVNGGQEGGEGYPKSLQVASRFGSTNELSSVMKVGDFGLPATGEGPLAASTSAVSRSLQVTRSDELTMEVSE